MLVHNHQWDLYDSAWHHFIAGGDLAGGQPEVTGTMRGAAVAQTHVARGHFHERAGTDLGIIADGTVEMTVRLGATPSFDISIGDWQGYNLTERGEIGLPAEVSIRDFEMRDIPIKADGTFYAAEAIRRDKDGEIIVPSYPDNSTSRWNGTVRGAFYGPGGGEAAGVFNASFAERTDTDSQWTGGDRVYGAFGVRKPK